jgi:hypothetical protein
MLTGRELYTFNLNALGLIGMASSGSLKWEDCTEASREYFEHLAESVHRHYTGNPSGATETFQALRWVMQQDEKTQREIYQALYKLGHRIYG